MKRDNRRVLTFGALIIAVIVLIGLGRAGVLHPLINLVTIPLKPVAGLLTDGTTSVLAMTGEREDYDALAEKVLEYERTIAELQVEVVRLREVEQDYYRLAELVDYQADNPGQNIVAADVIGQDTSSYLRWVILNKGTRDGIREGDPVVSDLGLVGRVETATAGMSWVRLVNDPASAVNARLQGADAEGTVVGQLQGGLRMEYIPQAAAIEVGDMALTSGLGGTFPPNIVIGQVTSVRRQQATFFQAAEVRPTVNFDNLRIVAVVTSFTPLDTSVLEPTGEGETP